MDATLSKSSRWDLVHGTMPVSWLVLWLAWPVLAQQLLILVVGLSDQFLAGYFPQVSLCEQVEALSWQLQAVGQLAGPGTGLAAGASLEHAWQIMARQVAYQAAQTTAHYLSWFLGSYMVLVSVGSIALVSRLLGAGEQAQAIHVTNQALLLAVVLGILGTVAGLGCLEPLIHWLGLRGHAAQYARDYLRPLLWLLVFQVVEQAGIACLIGAGDTRTGLWVLGGVAVVNVPLSWAFFHGLGPLPGLGFVGIALGTAVSHVLAALAVVVLLIRGRAGLAIQRSLLWPDWDWLRRLLRVSVPAALDSLSVAVGQLWFLSLVNDLGDVASTAHGIAIRWEGLAYLSGGAFGAAAMTLVGQHLGARQPEQAVRSAWVALAQGGGIMCCMAVVFFVLAPQMFLLFCPRPEQAGVIAVGVPVLRLVAFATPALACCIILAAALRGAGDTRVPVLFTWIGFLGVRLPLAYLLTRSTLDLGWLGHWPGYNLGLFGAWLAMAADLGVRGVFFLLRFAGGRWKTVQV